MTTKGYYTINPMYADRMKKQNHTIDLIDEGLTRLGENAKRTKEELDEQNKDLDDLDNDVENNLDAVRNTTGKINKQLNAKDCCCGYGYWPFITAFILIIIICIALLIWA